MPRLLRDIDSAVEDTVIEKKYNMLMCMFISPVMLLGALSGIVSRIFFHTDNPQIWMDDAAFLLFFLLAELLLRMDVKVRLATHLVSLLYSALFIYCVVRFYPVMGSLLWTFGFILILLSVSHISRIMLVYICITMTVSGLYTLIRYNAGIQAANDLTKMHEFFFFSLIFIIAFVIHHISTSRFSRIKKQLFDLKNEMVERMKAEIQNTRLALYDHLTGLPNRTLFYDRLNQAIEFAKRRDLRIYVAFVDLDHFKLVNDTMGHNTGDELLKRVAERMSGIVRSSDTVARIGGDEFLVLIRDAGGECKANAIIGRILAQISRPYRINQRDFAVTCSIGVARYPVDGADTETLIKHADLAMYKAKDDGRNRSVTYTDDLNQAIQNEVDLIEGMKLALKRAEFVLYYQPQIDTESKRITGVEALLRWDHPVLGRLTPDRFIPVAEKSGLIAPIGEWVLRAACAQNKAWRDGGLLDAPISVNVSVGQMKSRNFVGTVKRTMAETGLGPGYLKLEITEKVLIKDIRKVKLKLYELKKLGVRIAIDDFGTGYSSINYIRELPIDGIKIPLDFISGISKNVKDESIITVMLALAQGLSINVVAEGVETKGQLDFLTERGCSNIQGYYFCRPMQGRDVEAYFGKWAASAQDGSRG